LCDQLYKNLILVFQALPIYHYLYMLSESHISIHTFPEKAYIAFDLYTCRTYDDETIYMEIYDFLITELNAKRENPIIIKRSF
jgi:S-adenosylmethionine/arginine decarboxylase-like enzyme